MTAGLLRYVVSSMSPETLAREDAEALRNHMALADWIELRTGGVRSQVPPYVLYEVERVADGAYSISVRW